MPANTMQTQSVESDRAASPAGRVPHCASTAPTASPPPPGPLQRALSTAVTQRLLQRKISFDWSAMEIFGYSAGVTTAISTFDTVKTALAKLETTRDDPALPAEVRGWLAAQLTAARKLVDDWDEKAVPVDKRAGVIKDIASIDDALRELPQQVDERVRARAETERREQERERERLEQLAAEDAERLRIAQEAAARVRRAEEEEAARVRRAEEEAARVRRAEEEAARALRAEEEAQRRRLEREAAERSRLKQEWAELRKLYGPEGQSRRRAFVKAKRAAQAEEEDARLKAAAQERAEQTRAERQAALKGLASKKRKAATSLYAARQQDDETAASEAVEAARGRWREKAVADERRELGLQADLVGQEVSRLIGTLAGFATPQILASMQVDVDAARTAADAARALAGEETGFGEARIRLASAHAAVQSLASTVDVAKGARDLFLTRSAALSKAVEALQPRRPPRKHLDTQLALMDVLTLGQKIASLTDADLAGGVAALEQTLGVAQAVESKLDELGVRARALVGNALLKSAVKAKTKQLVALSWADLERSLYDETVESGLSALSQDFAVAERLQRIGAEIEALTLAPMRSHVAELVTAHVRSSWAGEIAHLAELEEGLRFARDVEARRAAALTAAGELENEQQRQNILGWLAKNAELSWEGQEKGLRLASEEHGLAKIEERLMSYNARYRMAREAAERAEARRLATIEARRVRREAAKAAAAELLSSGDQPATLRTMYDADRIAMGQLVRTYKSGYDQGPGEFSAEYTIEGLHGIVIHAHCEPDGTPKPGNGVHWKELRYKDRTGYLYNHPFPETLRPHMLDADQMKRNRDSNPKITW